MENNQNTLTDREFWKEYWQNYHYKPVPNRTFFDACLPEFGDATHKNMIEIGGFPGILSLYFYKKFGFKPTLLDFYIDKAIINRIERENDVAENTIECAESDFFAFQSDKNYDFVFSSGFIEHFNDTADVIARHVALLKSDGWLFIALPNFLGLNGFLQKIADRNNYEAHNLKSMDIKRLKSILNTMNLTDVRVTYTSKPMLWLEPKPTRKNKIARGVVKMLSMAIKPFMIKSKFLSPYICISARKR